MSAMFCPQTGEALQYLELPPNYRSVVAFSSRAAYLVVIDTRWGESPLLKLQDGVFEILKHAEPALLDLAFERVRRIDYRTVSIVNFEHTLLGCFDPQRQYRIIYPDGSEA